MISYAFNEGLIMEGPVGPWSAEINTFLYWYIYVGDILACFVATYT